MNIGKKTKAVIVRSRNIFIELNAPIKIAFDLTAMIHEGIGTKDKFSGHRIAEGFLGYGSLSHRPNGPKNSINSRWIIPTDQEPKFYEIVGNFCKEKGIAFQEPRI